MEAAVKPRRYRRTRGELNIGDWVTYFDIHPDRERCGIIIDANPKYKFVQFPNGDFLAILPENLDLLSSLD